MSSSIWCGLFAFLHPAPSSLECSFKQYLSLAVILDVVTWFNSEHAGCHLQERLRSKVAIITAIGGGGSAELP